MEVNNIYTTKPWSALITHANLDLWTQNVYTESSALRRWFIPRDWIVERRETQFISNIFFFLMKHTICLRETIAYLQPRYAADHTGHRGYHFNLHYMFDKYWQWLNFWIRRINPYNIMSGMHKISNVRFILDIRLREIYR